MAVTTGFGVRWRFDPSIKTITESSCIALIAVKLAALEGPHVEPGSIRRKEMALFSSAAFFLTPSRFSRSSNQMTKSGTISGSAAWSDAAPIRDTRARAILIVHISAEIRAESSSN